MAREKLKNAASETKGAAWANLSGEWRAEELG
jgi:hypothetical protein